MSHGVDQKKRAPKIIAVTSGKGGVGKTSVTVNTGIALSQKGYKVCLFDADANLANINILLGVAPEYTLQHVLSGEKDIREILLQKCGLYIVPGASGIADFIGLQLHAQQRMIQAMETLENDFDYLLVDTSSGIDSTVLSFVESANQSIVVITPEPTSLTDAFSLLRVLKKRGHDKKVNIVVNSVSTEQRAQKIYTRFADAVEKYLGYRPEFLGSVLKDELLSSAVCIQTPVIQYKPTAPSSNGFYRLADAIDKKIDFATSQTLSSQWKRHRPENESPDFSEKNADVQTNAGQIPVAEKQLTLDDHRKSILAAIDNSNTSKHELMSMMAEFTEAYIGRFNAYPLDAAKMLYHALELNSIPMDQVNDLMMILQLTYESNFDYADKESATRYLCSLVNNYVEKHQQYPFDAISTLYQALDLVPLSEAGMRKLLTTLHLIYRDKYLSADKKEGEEKPSLLCCAEDDNDELEKLTALIQQKHLINLEHKIKQEFGHREDDKDTVKKAEGSVSQSIASDVKFAQQPEDAADDYDSLLDSIRYASRLD